MAAFYPHLFPRAQKVAENSNFTTSKQWECKHEAASEDGLCKREPIQNNNPNCSFRNNLRDYIEQQVVAGGDNNSTESSAFSNQSLSTGGQPHSTTSCGFQSETYFFPKITLLGKPKIKCETHFDVNNLWD